MERIIDVLELKKIANDICMEESINNGKNYKINAVTPLEFYRDYLLKKPSRLLMSPMFYLMHPLMYGGYNDSVDGIVIYVKKINGTNLKENNMLLYEFISACYHEIRHSVQHEFSKYSYDEFLRSVEYIIKTLANNFDYFLRHNDYSFEIGANLYATEKAKLYMQKYYPEEYKLVEEEINLIIEYVLTTYYKYDVIDTVDAVFNCIKMNRYKLDNIKEIVDNSVLPIFINNDYSFKSISEIMNNEEVKKLDKRIIYSVLASNSYRDSIDTSKLSFAEKNLFNTAIEYFDNIKKNQQVSFKKHNSLLKKKTV